MNFKLLLVITLIAVIFSTPFFNKGYFKTDDGEWAIIRLSEMNRELSDFQIPPRWSDFLNHGYGYPLFLFTYPLPYYIGNAFLIFGAGLTTSIKAIFILCSIFAALGMYFFTRKYWGDWGAFLSSIFYITAPYRLVNLYIRGSIGESLALAIVPWLFLCLDNIDKSKFVKFFASILLALLVISHNISGLVFTGLLFIYFLVSFAKNKQKLINSVVASIFGLLLSAYFWLPLFFEKKYIFAGINQIANKSLHFVSISDLVFHNLTYSIKPPVFIGYLHLLILITSGVLLLLFKTLKQKFITGFFFIASLISLLFMFPQSEFLWNIPLASFIDFPWRLMMVVVFSVSVLSGSVNLSSHGKYICVILSIAAIILYIPLVSVSNRIYREDSYYQTNDATTTSNNELIPVWVLSRPTNNPNSKVIALGDVNNIHYNSKEIAFDINSPQIQDIIINTIYFPGWIIKVNNNMVETKITDPQGLIQFTVEKGLSKVSGSFTKTPIRVVSDYISIFSFVILLGYLFYGNLKLHKK